MTCGTGVGSLVCTFLYMYVWVYTGEVNAKRIREHYLRATLRQEVAYFDKVGAGEVATRIQTDTRTSPGLRSTVFAGMYAYINLCRLGAARYLGKGRALRELHIFVPHRFHHGVHTAVAAGSCDDERAALYSDCRRCDEHLCLEIHAVSSTISYCLTLY